MPKSIKEVNEMNKLYPIGYSPKQLLVNNDFQVNQRGQSEYVSKGYSLDMWYFQNYNKANAKLEPTKNGIRMTNNDDSEMAIYQYAYAETKQIVTLVAKVNGKIYSISGLPTGSGETPTIVVEERKIELNVRYYDNDKRYRVYAMVGSNNSASIEYIDLFEGDVAYPHVKEDYATVLMRCQQMVKRYIKVSNSFISFNTDDLIYAIDLDDIKDISKATIVINSFDVKTVGFGSYEGFTLDVYQRNKNTILFKASKKNHALTLNNISSLKIDFTISCEPV